MADSAKRISDGSFKNTIKMTLTTEGHLGIGNIDPKFTVTSAGLVQGRSSISILPLVAGVGLTGKGFKVGLDAWDGDVHTQIGQVTSDGSNNGCIQVSAGGAPGGIGFGGTAYGLSLQPSGGNVGIGMTQATSRLQVNGNIRTDVDFVTGTDTPGWVLLPMTYGNLGSPSVLLVGDGSGNTGFNTTQSWYSYKIIGKTVHLSFRITGFDFTTNNNEFFYLPIPPACYPVSNRTAGTQLNRIETGFAFYRNSNYSESEKACQVNLIANTVAGTYPAGMWYIRLMGMTRTNQMNPAGTLNTIALGKWFADTGPGGQQQVASSFEGSITYGLI